MVTWMLGFFGVCAILFFIVLGLLVYREKYEKLKAEMDAKNKKDQQEHTNRIVQSHIFLEGGLEHDLRDLCLALHKKNDHKAPLKFLCEAIGQYWALEGDMDTLDNSARLISKSFTGYMSIRMTGEYVVEIFITFADSAQKATYFDVREPYILYDQPQQVPER
jgi:hypothetical protein